MPERIAKVTQFYAGRKILPGESFHVDPEHERLLELLCRIESLETPRAMAQPAPATYATRVMTAAVPAKPKKTRNRQSLIGKGARA